MEIIRRLIREMIELDIISEGLKDIEYIESLNISEKDKSIYLDGESRNLKMQEIKWIENTRGSFDLYHIIQSVLEFKSESFKNKVKIKSVRINDPSFLNYLNLSSFSSIQDLDSFIENINIDLSAYDRSKIVPLETGNDLEIIGQVGPWTIILPKTIRGSVSCDYENPKSTTWCTTKRSGQNLFYSFVGTEEKPSMLFYVMDYNRKPDDLSKPQTSCCKDNNDSRMCVGFINSRISLGSQDGTISVDAANKGLTEKCLRLSLGENYEKIMKLIKESVKKHNGISPAMIEVKNASKSIETLISISKDYSSETKIDFIRNILFQKNVSQEVLMYFLKDPRKEIREALASSPSVDEKLLEKLATDQEPLVRYIVAKNPLTNKDTLLMLSDDKSDFVKHCIARYTSHLDILEKMSKNTDPGIRAAVALNPNSNFNVLNRLSNDSIEYVRKSVAMNHNVDFRILKKLSEDLSPDVRTQVASNSKTDRETLVKLSKDENKNVRSYARHNIKIKSNNDL